MSPIQRKIIHCDCDCFYASVEMRDDPRLRGRPLAVGGQAQQRGVIATCNYEARAFGVRSAMPTAQALKLCPHLLVLPPHIDKYRQASRRIMAIYRDYTDLVEPLSLDEAYLDVTQAERCQGSATLIAQEIRQRIAQEVGITASAGVAPNKFLAKIASDWHKPDGLFVIRPEQVDSFVASLPVARLFGVGIVTAARLHQLGIHQCQDLLDRSLPELLQQFGKLGSSLYSLCRGIDHRPVVASSERKSLSVEETYVHDLPTLDACIAELPALYAELEKQAKRTQIQSQIHKLNIKIRFDDFKQTTVECRAQALDAQKFQELLSIGYRRRQRPVRLLGLGIGVAEKTAYGQRDLFEEVTPAGLAE